MNCARRQVPSALQVYNKFMVVYFKYFHGHAIKPGKHIPEQFVYSLDAFVQKEFEKLECDLKKFEAYLIWVFSTHGSKYITDIPRYIDDYLKDQNKSANLKPFSVQMSKYIRDNKVKSWEEYTSTKGTGYPIIIQHYLKDRDFPFEFLLFLKVFDKIPDLQKKMLKSVFGKEMYNLKERTELAKKNIAFFREQMIVVNDAFKYTSGR